MGSEEDSATTVDRSKHVKDAIRAAAQHLFALNGYGATGIRDIATVAGVNSALVIRHFGSKEALFLATMRVQGEFSALMAGSVDDLGERTVSYLLSDEADKHLRGVYTALLRASDRTDIREQLRSTLQSKIIRPIADQLATGDAELRAQFFAAQMSGLMSALWVSSDAELREVARDVIIRRYGALLQSALTEPWN